jgi:RecA/RadA recombinase
MLVKEMKNVQHFQTGDDELDKHLKEEGISSDELVEVCGVSGSGKTYFCLKMVSLALLEKDIAAIYVDTTNYVNQTNVNLVLRNFMSQSNQEEKTKKVQEVMGRLRVMKIYELDHLILLLS